MVCAYACSIYIYVYIYTHTHHWNIYTHTPTHMHTPCVRQGNLPLLVRHTAGEDLSIMCVYMYMQHVCVCMCGGVCTHTWGMTFHSVKMKGITALSKAQQKGGLEVKGCLDSRLRTISSNRSQYLSLCGYQFSPYVHNTARTRTQNLSAPIHVSRRLLYVWKHTKEIFIFSYLPMQWPHWCPRVQDAWHRHGGQRRSGMYKCARVNICIYAYIGISTQGRGTLTKGKE